MSKLYVLPHPNLCPQGIVIEDTSHKESICHILLNHNIGIEHVCECSCACTTCHIIVREGYTGLSKISDSEEDLLDKAWGLTATSRLSCQAVIINGDVTIEIPKYSINHVTENADA